MESNQPLPWALNGKVSDIVETSDINIAVLMDISFELKKLMHSFRTVLMWTTLLAGEVVLWKAVVEDELIFKNIFMLFLLHSCCCLISCCSFSVVCSVCAKSLYSSACC